jgi:hypothetical protein
MNIEARKIAERAILENINDEAACKDILTKAFTAGLFTEEEVNITVAEIKAWNDRNKEKVASPEQLRISKALLKALGPFPALTLVLLIKQFPKRSIGDGWMQPDVPGICKALKYKSPQFYGIVNTFQDRGLLEKTVDKRIKKLVIKLNFFAIQDLYEGNTDEPDEPHDDSSKV